MSPERAAPSCAAPCCLRCCASLGQVSIRDKRSGEVHEVQMLEVFPWVADTNPAACVATMHRVRMSLQVRVVAQAHVGRRAAAARARRDVRRRLRGAHLLQGRRHGADRAVLGRRGRAGGRLLPGGHRGVGRPRSADPHDPGDGDHAGDRRGPDPHSSGPALRVSSSSFHRDFCRVAPDPVLGRQGATSYWLLGVVLPVSHGG